MLNKIADISDVFSEIFSGVGALRKRRTLQNELKNEAEIRKGDKIPHNLLGNSSGFFFGKRFGKSVIKSSKQGGNILGAGGTGTSKTTGLNFPTMESWHDGMVIVDLNGESLEHYKALERPKRPFKVLNLMRGRDCVFRYDPFHMIRQGGEENTLLLLRELALAIIPLLPDVREPFWIQSAQNILTGAFIYYSNIGAKFTDAMMKIQKTSFAVLIGNISTHETAKMYVNQFSEIENLAESKMVAGIRAELSNHIIPFVTDSQVIEAFNPASSSSPENIIVWDDIETHNIFITVDESEIEQKSSAIRLLLTQLIRHLERRPDKHSPEGKSLTPILIMCDEFPRYGKLESIESAIATLRKRNVTIAIFVQSLAQIDKFYGEKGRRILLDNCSYNVLLGATDLESQQYFSELIGSIIVKQKSYGESYNNRRVEPQGYRTQVSETRELIYQPHELARLGNRMILITPDGFCKVIKSPCYHTPKRKEGIENDET